jgi:hypothetical protein
MKQETKEKIRTYKTEWQRRQRRIAAGQDPDAPPLPVNSNFQGAKNPNAKLTLREVRRARRMRDDGMTIRSIADKIGMSYTATRALLKGETWGD